ncbi:MAG TPA: FAD-dependent oxidoreductase [Chitinophagaceae bacterium]|nr:FAD-dependent oxidoreductase [Chitinophagaceae bacterium]
MQKHLLLRLHPREAADDELLREAIAAHAGVPASSVKGWHFLKRSIDARTRPPRIQLSLKAFIDEPAPSRPATEFRFRECRRAAKQVAIAGAGPAGLFAALLLMEHGVKPILIERGKDVRARRRDLAALNREGIVDPDSNYCFGEGGAGTYSDGKLYTRSVKRGNLERVLDLFVHFGGAENILFDSHPHIGTNKLPGIITAMRETIRQRGGEIHFQKRVTDFIIENGGLRAMQTSDGERISADAFILATGHSARDIFQLLQRHRLEISFKPFALGVRVEHPQALIDELQYHLPARDAARRFLPPASYSWVQQASEKPVFSFCMCPGGIIAPAATSPGEIVVNGWSPSRRNNPYANSGIVVAVDLPDLEKFHRHGALAGIYFQQHVEQRAFLAGGSDLAAPAQRLTDFIQGRTSSSLPGCSYLPGIRSANLAEVLPDFICKSLVRGFRGAGKRMKGYLTEEAVVVAVESRTSSPVRIARTEKLHHPQLRNLYPCGEGAGYAGGIVSAAMDGERVARQILLDLGMNVSSP